GGFELDGADRALDDRAKDDLGREDLAAPPVVVALEDDLAGGLPADELEGPGAHDDRRAVVLAGGRDGSLAEDGGRGVREVDEERREGRGRRQADGVVVDRFDRVREADDERRGG